MLHFVMNPMASSGVGRKVFKRLRPILKENNVEYNIEIFRNEEDLAAYIRALTGKNIPENAEEIFKKKVIRSLENSMSLEEIHLVVLGGDGTLNLVLNSIADMEHTKLSCIRIGSGNDFARNMGVSKRAEEALLHLINEPEEHMLDYGISEYITEENEVRSRRFLISSGIGYDADICEEAGRSTLKKLLNFIHLGRLIYLMIGIKHVFLRDTAKAKIYLDDSPCVHVHDLFFVVGMIHKMEGGGVPFCPHANPHDGYLDVCVVRGVAVPKLLLEVAMVYMEKHLLFSNVFECRCKKLRVVVDTPQWIHMDGETPCKIKEVTHTCELGLRYIK